MSGSFASNKRALSICDRCGFDYPLKDLKTLTINREQVGLKVCPECWEADQPQLHLGEAQIYDPQALREPRPDNAEYAAMRAQVVAFQPVQMFLTVATVVVVQPDGLYRVSRANRGHHREFVYNNGC